MAPPTSIRTAIPALTAGVNRKFSHCRAGARHSAVCRERRARPLVAISSKPGSRLQNFPYRKYGLFRPTPRVRACFNMFYPNLPAGNGRESQENHEGLARRDELSPELGRVIGPAFPSGKPLAEPPHAHWLKSMEDWQRATPSGLPASDAVEDGVFSVPTGPIMNAMVSCSTDKDTPMSAAIPLKVSVTSRTSRQAISVPLWPRPPRIHATPLLPVGEFPNTVRGHMLQGGRSGPMPTPLRNPRERPVCSPGPRAPQRQRTGLRCLFGRPPYGVRCKRRCRWR